ncbi:O-antigen ligase-like membrane protein [Arcticibacter pallidicorallinus]|uniref:O-antigen ligase-like membrane protein n=1 Tax=Arcticibacter pallidicorallinus TaxID=1259464 RepID=A0A2T0TRK7_9SPHI|nr:O-antigen ligase family protein [Arcticibacter pallidicorallinus]PRY48316.1 O-antigen ligase-like membrane protein [Arcticibacter pallidicorallinus]
MNFRKAILLVLVFMYIYTLTFGLFMTSVIRLPTPIVFCFPLIYLTFDKSRIFQYRKELLVFTVVSFFYFLLAYQEITSFFVQLIVVTFCALYFNYFVGENLYRFKVSVFIFYSLLIVSSLVMLLDHANPTIATIIRQKLTGEIVKQSPSGITPYIFSFGYQLAALTPFLVISSVMFRKGIVLKLLALVSSLIFIFYGMNRSVLVIFLFCIFFFGMLYYKLKFTILIAAFGIIGTLFISSVQDLSSGNEQNILAKNEQSSDENRMELMTENLKIIAKYPYGLMFYGMSWYDAAKEYPTFRRGEAGFVTSHNAYLMFITHLGIVIGPLFLFMLYSRIVYIMILALKHIRDPDNALLVCLCFSFLSVSINPFFHNEWLLRGSGPTLFLYFGVIHLYGIIQNNKLTSDSATNQNPQL